MFLIKFIISLFYTVSLRTSNMLIVNTLKLLLKYILDIK